MKPNARYLILTIFMLMLLTSCTSKNTVPTQDSTDAEKTTTDQHTPLEDNTTIDSATPETNDKPEGSDTPDSESQTTSDNASNSPQQEDVITPEIIDVARAENTSNFTYSAALTTDADGISTLRINLYDTDNILFQTLAYPVYFDEDWFNMFTSNGGEVCRFVDFNLDGFPDAVTQLYGAMVNQSYNVWLYLPDDAVFESSEEYASQSNPRINTKERFVLSTNYTLGIPSYELSYVDKGHLAYFASLNGDITESSITYTQRLYGYFDAEGTPCYREIQSVSEISSPQELDAIWQAFDITMPK